MVINKRKSSKVQSAQKRLRRAEQKAQQAKMSYHATIGELAASGATEREIGGELGLSHQRVHQILEELSCDFCGAPRREAERMIAAGYGGHICDLCVAIGEKVLGNRSTESDGRTTMRFVSPENRPTCTFCGVKQNKRSKGMASHKANRICPACVTLCREIIDEEERNEAAKKR